MPFRIGHYFFRNTLELASSEAIEPDGPLLFWTSVEVMRWVIPIVACSAGAVSVFAGLAQGGFVFAPEALSFKFERLSPADRLEPDVFSGRRSATSSNLFCRSRPSPGSALRRSEAIGQRFWAALMLMRAALPA